MDQKSLKQIIKHDIEHLYLKGLTTLKSLRETYNIPSYKMLEYEEEVIKEMIARNKEPEYFPAQKEILLGHLAINEYFIPSELNQTKSDLNLYRVIKTTTSSKILVMAPSGKQEVLPSTLKVIIKKPTD